MSLSPNYDNWLNRGNPLDAREHPKQSKDAAIMYDELTEENVALYERTWESQSYGEYGDFDSPDDYLKWIFKKQVEELSE